LRNVIYTFVKRTAVVRLFSAGAGLLDITLDSLIVSADTGDPFAKQQLFSALYGELHRLAKRELRRNVAALPLGATTLLHEAFLDISPRQGMHFPDRAHFMAYASRAMRGLIIDYARSHQAQKRGGGFDITSLKTDSAAAIPDAAELTRIGDALDELAAVEPALAEVVDLKFFGGFSCADIATMRGVSERTIQRDWEKARIYLIARSGVKRHSPENGGRFGFVRNSQYSY
jgi:RNA polymerase sigma factor (TIGR02999 family)